MVKKGDRILAAVSGGSDSIFLLYMLLALKSLLSIEIYAAHMDHGIRGADSKKDAEFVLNLAKKLKVKCAYEKLNPKKLNSKLSLEENLREKRYEFLKKSAGKFKLNTIATAHTLDDQAETVLMRITKGTSLKGLVGIHPVRDDKKFKFIRPVIEIEKAEILKYLKVNKILFRTDKTNFQNTFLRNRIRNRVLPYLAKINPRIKRSLFNLSVSLSEDFEFIESEKKKRSGILKRACGMQCIMLKDVVLQPKAIQKELMRELIKSAGGNVKKLTFRHWKDIDELMRTKQSGKILNLPDKVSVKKEKDRLVFCR
ncbi:MAG: tRNA lysidine(34) synthetase TilS [Candidatus Omnitrophota bacterium]